LTRKDYIAIAEALRQARGMDGQSGKHIAAVECATDFIADAMAADNPRFDRNHFLKVVRGERELQSRPPRNKRPNLCPDCKVEEHDQCSLTMGCPCCEQTVRQSLE